MNSDTLIVMPTFNELENVSLMTHAIFKLNAGFHILFIDDNSPDGTGEKIKQLQLEFPEMLRLISRKSKMGLGTAYIHGFQWALDHNYTYIFEMDCDFSHDPEDLTRLKEACSNGADLVIGSRYCKGGKVRNWPFKRILMSYFASVYVRIVLLINIKDTTSGFKCYHRKVLEKIQLQNNIFKGYAFQICMKYGAIKHGFKIKEVPIIFTDRIRGKSKMSAGIFKEAFLGVWKMKGLDL